MEQFRANFQSEEEKNYFVGCLILGIFFGFIPFLVAIFGFKDKFSNENMEILKAFCNFDLLIFIASMCINMVPIIQWFGFLIAPAFFIINLIIILKALSAINQNLPFQIPVFFKIF